MGRPPTFNARQNATLRVAAEVIVNRHGVQSGAAAQLGVSPAALSQFLRGNTGASSALAESIAAASNMSVETLLSEKGALVAGHRALGDAINRLYNSRNHTEIATRQFAKRIEMIVGQLEDNPEAADHVEKEAFAALVRFFLLRSAAPTALAGLVESAIRTISDEAWRGGISRAGGGRLLPRVREDLWCFEDEDRKQITIETFGEPLPGDP